MEGRVPLIVRIRASDSDTSFRKTPMTKFSDLKLDPKVLQAIAEAGYETPTPIQAGAIPPALEGRDVLGIAQTGTGKTASFTLPMITLLGRGRARARMPRSLVLAPTRELAAQVAENFDTYAKHTRLTKALLIGGVSMRDQEQLIDRGVDVLIATPGRLMDLFRAIHEVVFAVLFVVAVGLGSSDDVVVGEAQVPHRCGRVAAPDDRQTVDFGEGLRDGLGAARERLPLRDAHRSVPEHRLGA